MNEAEVEQAMQHLSGLFPSIAEADDALILLWKRKLAAVDELDHAVAGIEDARTKTPYDRATFPLVFGCIAEAQRKTPTRRQSASSGGDYRAGILRKQMGLPQTMPDVEVIIRYHRSLWYRYILPRQQYLRESDREAELAKQQDRFTREAVSNLSATAMDETTAREFAELIFRPPTQFETDLHWAIENMPQAQEAA